MRRSVTEEELESVRASEQEFAAAMTELADKPNGHDLPLGQSTYIKIQDQIYQITNFELGRGTYSTALLAYGQNGERYAMKISTDSSWLNEEVEVETDLGFFSGAIEKVTASGEIQYVRLMPYFGKNLEIYTTNRPVWLTPLKLFSFLLQATQEILDLHSGKKSKAGHGYFHRDIKPANFVMNREEQIVTLIDFGLAARIAPQQTQLFSNEKVGSDRKSVV